MYYVLLCIAKIGQFVQFLRVLSPFFTNIYSLVIYFSEKLLCFWDYGLFYALVGKETFEASALLAV